MLLLEPLCKLRNDLTNALQVLHLTRANSEVRIMLSGSRSDIDAANLVISLWGAGRV